MSRIATIIASTGVGSYHVGLKDLAGTESRVTFHLVSSSPFVADILATNNFDFVSNVGSNWYSVTKRAFLDQGAIDPDFIQINGFPQLIRQLNANKITKTGIYAMDIGFMPAAFQVNVTSITSGSPLGIFFGV